MSRNGRLFFYFSTAFFADRKVKILKARYGADGILLYLYLLCEIYRAEGYYLQYDDDAEYLIADELGMNYEKIGQILNFLLERSLFDNHYPQLKGKSKKHKKEIKSRTKYHLTK